MKEPTKRTLVVTCLAFLIVAVYAQMRNHEFVSYDDLTYVVDNPHVRTGWSWQGLVWAFTTGLHGHWHPVTWLSHMTDAQLFGLEPGWHHLSSLFLHIVTSLLLFGLLRQATGSVFRSGFVAALFSLHPLHVEPVAWVADRKDILAALFWMSTVWLYGRYARSPGPARYAWVLIAFALGLMSKSMIVTLPVVLLLWDYWPLGRYEGAAEKTKGKEEGARKAWYMDPLRRLASLLWEKLPLFALIGVFAAVAVVVMHESVSQYAPSLKESRIEVWAGLAALKRAVAFYLIYLRKTFWPLGLAIPYSRPGSYEVWQWAGAGLFLLAVSAAVVWKGRRFAYLPVGWFWFLLTLLPVIGIVKVGPHLIADRYTYIPLVGVFLMVSWGGGDLLDRWRGNRALVWVLPGLVILVLLTLSWKQVRHWKDSVALFQHAINVTKGNWVAHTDLGAALFERGKQAEAIVHYREALHLNPGYRIAHNNLGSALMDQGRLDEAIGHFSEALRIKPDYGEAHANLAMALGRKGDLKKAREHVSEALRIDPDSALAHFLMGLTLAGEGKPEEGKTEFQAALRLNPTLAEAHNELGALAVREGDLAQAETHFRRAIEKRPNSAEAHFNMGVILQGQGKRKEAVGYFSAAVRLNPNHQKARAALKSMLGQ